MTIRCLSRPWAAVLGAVAVTLVGCGGGDAPVSVGPPSPPAPTLQRLTLDTLFQIGAESGESWQRFGGIWDVDVSSSGQIAVLDIETGQVHVYNSSGDHLGSVTESGLEPGALEGPTGLAWRDADNLLVWDPGSSWISRFTVGKGVSFADQSRAFAFGETGFCAEGDRVYLSYWQDDLVVHQLAKEGPVRSFGTMPEIPGMAELGPELQEIGIEELTPSGLLCTPSGVLDVAFYGSRVRMHDASGSLLWETELADFNPLSVYSPDGMGLGRQFDAAEGTQLLRSLVAWGDEYGLVQYEVRTREYPEEGEVPVIESRLVRLSDGAEVDRTRDLPVVLSSWGRRLFLPATEPFPRVIVAEVAGN